MELNLKDRLVLACDQSAVLQSFGDTSEAEKLIGRLGRHVGWVKLNSAFISGGSKLVKLARVYGAKVWLDLKWHDVPDTVANYVSEAINELKSSVSMFNVHASGGSKMMKAVAIKLNEMFADDMAEQRPLAIAITVLTSLGEEGFKELGFTCTIAEQVLRLAALTKNAGLNGVVASPLEAKMLRAKFGKDFLIVTPGIRFDEESKDGQARVTTPMEAIANGADMIVMGTSLIKGGLPAVERAYIEIEEGLRCRG